MSKDWLSSSRKVSYGDIGNPYVRRDESYEEEVGHTKYPDHEYDSYYKHFIKRMRSFWATKHTEDTAENRELFIKTTVRELVIYLIFLIIFMIITYGMIDGLTYRFTNSIGSLFTDPYLNVKSVDDFWTFLQGPLLSGLYWTQWYNNAPIDNSQINFINNENKLIGVPRLRQVRVRNDSCAIVDDYKGDVTLCYADYSSSIESTYPFGLANSTAWNYTSEKNLTGQSTSGTITSYSGGGYYMDLNTTMSDTLNTLGFLMNNLWIDRGTRAVIIEFTVYNANINLFCVIKLISEFPATGGMIPNYEVRPVKLIRYATSMDYFVMICELIFIVFIIYYIVEEIIEIKKHGLGYFNSFWNCLDILVICAGITCVSLNLFRSISVHQSLQNLLTQTNNFPNFSFISYWQVTFNYAIALTLFLSWIKVFKYISFNKTMTQLNATLEASARDLGGFAMMFFVVFLGFAQLGYLLFGTQCDSFRSFNKAVTSLLRMILGDFDYNQIQLANRILGPIYYVLYIFFVFFVLFNMFMAIINDTYTHVKEELANASNEFEVTDYLKQQAEAMLTKLNLKRENIIDLQGALGAADSNNDNQLDFDEWKEELKKRGFADAEIESVFAKYDTDGNRVIDAKERREMQLELENQKAALNNEIKNSKMDQSLNGSMKGDPVVIETVNVEEYLDLSSRIDDMENKISNILSKVDNILQNVEQMEINRTKRRQALGFILELLTSNENLNDEDRRKKIEKILLEELNRNKGLHLNQSRNSGLKF